MPAEVPATDVVSDAIVLKTLLIRTKYPEQEKLGRLHGRFSLIPLHPLPISDGNLFAARPKVYLRHLDARHA
jgi:hypothetical protein